MTHAVAAVRPRPHATPPSVTFDRPNRAADEVTPSSTAPAPSLWQRCGKAGGAVGAAAAAVAPAAAVLAADWLVPGALRPLRKRLAVPAGNAALGMFGVCPSAIRRNSLAAALAGLAIVPPIEALLALTPPPVYAQVVPLARTACLYALSGNAGAGAASFATSMGTGRQDLVQLAGSVAYVLTPLIVGRTLGWSLGAGQ